VPAFAVSEEDDYAAAPSCVCTRTRMSAAGHGDIAQEVKDHGSKRHAEVNRTVDRVVGGSKFLHLTTFEKNCLTNADY
jgi:hypothetical protein